MSPHYDHKNDIAEALPGHFPPNQADSLVCVGDLPPFNYKASIETITEEVTKYLETHPELPGVILVGMMC
jgi:hypothetical protein